MFRIYLPGYTMLVVHEGIISIYLQDSDKWISVSSPT